MYHSGATYISLLAINTPAAKMALMSFIFAYCVHFTRVSFFLLGHWISWQCCINQELQPESSEHATVWCTGAVHYEDRGKAWSLFAESEHGRWGRFEMKMPPHPKGFFFYIHDLSNLKVLIACLISTYRRDRVMWALELCPLLIPQATWYQTGPKISPPL